MQCYKPLQPAACGDVFTAVQALNVYPKILTVSLNFSSVTGCLRQSLDIRKYRAETCARSKYTSTRLQITYLYCLELPNNYFSENEPS